LVVGSLLNVEEPRVHIEVQASDGTSAAAFADRVAADALANLPGLKLERRTITLEGVEAVVLDGLPYQDPAREVFVVHGGRLYRLMFAPSDRTLGATFEKLEALFNTVTGSFRFLP
jgi:hypothetical protein